MARAPAAGGQGEPPGELRGAGARRSAAGGDPAGGAGAEAEDRGGAGGSAPEPRPLRAAG